MSMSIIIRSPAVARKVSADPEPGKLVSQAPGSRRRCLVGLKNTSFAVSLLQPARPFTHCTPTGSPALC